MDEKSLDSWLSDLEQLHPSAIDLGLTRCGEVAERLDLLSTPATTITVAGTNGKGSTVAVMESILCEQGLSCGAFTSPHLIRYAERIRVNGEEVKDELIVQAFEEIDVARGDISLTYFEFGALAALWVFREMKVTHQLLEVGLGGRLDAVNIVDAEVAVITAIGLDHQEWLGSDVETIAIEKCGIARSGQPCVVADEHAPVTVMSTLEKIGSQAVRAGDQYHFSDQEFFGAGARSFPWNIPEGVIPLNAAAAVTALQCAGIRVDEKRFAAAKDHLTLRGRREHINMGTLSVVMDVAHNPDAARQLVGFLGTLPPVDKTIAVFAVMSDKDCHDMISALERDVDFWCLPRGIGGARGQDPDHIAAFLGGNSGVFESFNQSLDHALAQLAGVGRLLILGSFFTVAAGLEALESIAQTSTGGGDV